MDVGSGAENEDVKLQDRGEELKQLRDLQERPGKLNGSRPDLPARVGFSEEEKLKMAKDLLDVQIEANKMKEQYEMENFELKNKVLALEQRAAELERCRRQGSRERSALREQLQALQGRRQELAEEYIALKGNYLALSKQLEREVVKNEELSTELLSLAKSRGSLPHTESNHPTAMAGEASAELGRARARLRRDSARRVKAEEAAPSEHQQQELEANLPGDQDHIKGELEKLKKTYDWQQQKLEERVVAMEKELQEAKAAAGHSQQKLVEQSAVLLSSQRQLQEVEAENSQLQLRLKELQEEYRCRLARSLRELAAYMDSKSSKAAGPSRAPAGAAAMKSFVESMLKEIRASYKAREEQLATAAQGYRRRLRSLARGHQSLLIAYGLQREQIRALGSSTMDCGPAELHFCITEPELLSSTARELNRLREEKARLELQLQELRLQALQQDRLKLSSALLLPPEQLLAEKGWAELRKQLQEFTHNTQEDLEQERSRLLARAVAAEEQVAELQEYIGKHLARYKQQVLQLQQLAGGAGLAAGLAAGPAPSLDAQPGASSSSPRL
ncbi:coiled-coil domain-containing protein 78 [Dryobates pubescens]|uniref:coiled-coil domain-containing protein 78 n=1 Tax=Dryobates pubescens TaxID=118200 RepID=UPI0023B98DC0|nr:coiled-coil domain-containing protein 78 [Dryobates pubescens]